MQIIETPIPGLYCVDTFYHEDARGQFGRIFCRRELDSLLHDKSIVQGNYSQTIKSGSIRGLHYQRAPHAEIKLVRCLTGRIWDVAVDLRRDSPTFLHWHAEELSASNRRMLVIPEGCAHGFQTLEDDCEMLYLHTEYYRPDCEAGIRFDDPQLCVAWPLAVTELSPRDASLPTLESTLSGEGI